MYARHSIGLDRAVIVNISHRKLYLSDSRFETSILFTRAEHQSGRCVYVHP